MPQSILVVDDELSIQELLTYNLQTAGYRVLVAGNGLDALNICQQQLPDLVLLDLMLPTLDGLEVCRRLKTYSQTAAIPIIMLTAKGDELDKVVGLELGADDYVTKPFGVRELMARVKALLRRTLGGNDELETVLREGRLVIDGNSYKALLGGQELELTHKEFELLRLMARNKGRVLTREELLDQIWGYDYMGETRTVDVHVRHIRQKIGDAWIETVRGVGYRFRQSEEGSLE